MRTGPSPRVAIPSTLRYPYLPKPAMANLLQVQEAVPAQVRGLEESHYGRTGDSKTAQPNSLFIFPPSLPGPRELPQLPHSTLKWKPHLRAVGKGHWLRFWAAAVS